jgi:signal recognition particle GTPase
MDELAKVRRIIDKRLPGAAPETLFVLDATTGQNGLAQAKAFHEAVGLTGIVLTKLDSTAKGGIVFAIEDALDVPVRFVGVGEGVGDLLAFDPDAFVAALLRLTLARWRIAALGRRRRERDERADERAVAPQADVRGSALDARIVPPDSTIRPTGPSGRGRLREGCGTLAPPGASEPAHHPDGSRRPGLFTVHGALARTMFDTLSDRLRQTLGNLTGRGRISEADVDAAMREVRSRCSRPDVNFKVVKDFVARVRERPSARGPRQPVGRPAGRQDRQRRARRAPLGRRPDVPPDRQPGRRRDGRPAGLGQDDVQRQARRHVVKLGRRPLLVAADPYRPAAADQLETLGQASNIPVYRAPVGTPVVDIVRGGVEAARRQSRRRDPRYRRSPHRRRGAHGGAHGGRRARCHPVETLLVVDSDDRAGGRLGRAGIRRGRAVTGLILTKIEGDARGGAALSISAGRVSRSSSWAPARRRTALEVFHPDRLASRILGMATS